MKPMSAKKFLKHKNQILFNHTGLWLIPKDQIKKCEVRPLRNTGDSEACPYCAVYKSRTFENCVGCPMFEAGNSCFNVDSSYRKLVDNHRFITTKESPWHYELSNLIAKFNKSNGFK